jgi:pimeloyl-ACP methyl ester carboxylesterase
MKKSAANRAPNLRRAYFETRFGQLHCRTGFPSTGGFDELTPLVVLHDVPGTSADLAALLPELGRDRSVYLPDLPGCGQSDGPAAAVTIGEYGASVGEMLQNLRLREVDLLGVGVGAAIAVELALLLGQGVRRLVLCMPPLVVPADSTSVPARADGSHLLAEWQRGLPADPELLGVHTRAVGARLAGGPAAYWPVAALANWSAAERCAELKTAALVIEGEAAGRSAKALMPSARVESFAAAGRFAGAALERNLRSIREFLDV